MSRERLTRDQVEQRLKDHESKIAGRIESIESSMPGRSIARLSRISTDRMIKIGAFAGAGLVVGLLYGLRRKSRKPVDLDDGLDRLSSRISDAIRDELESGEDTEQAVRKALSRTPPILKLQESERSVLGEAVHQFSRLLTRELARSGSKKLLRNLGLMDPVSDDDGDESTGSSPARKAAGQ